MNTTDVGVCIGRFQLPDLHEAHRAMIEKISQKHDKVIVFLGLSAIFDAKDPLDFDARRKMFAAEFPDAIIGYIKDTKEDDDWSEKLDENIENLTGPNQTVTLYGGRDSFIAHYSGRFPTQELEQEYWVSASEIRAMVKNQVKGSKDFRHGVIWGSWQRYPTAFHTVDIVIYNEAKDKILLAQKKNEKKWRFVGGFVSPSDPSTEAAANRELREEIGGARFQDIDAQDYIGSTKIDDWRYRGKDDQIITSVFETVYQGGSIIAQDDICAAKWFGIDGVKEYITDSHIPIYELAIKV